MSMCLANAELLQTMYKTIHSCMCHCSRVSGVNLHWQVYVVCCQDDSNRYYN